MDKREQKLLEANKDALGEFKKRLTPTMNENKGRFHLTRNDGGSISLNELEQFCEELLVIALEEPCCSCGSNLVCPTCEDVEPEPDDWRRH